MSPRTRVLLLVVIMSGIAVGVTAITLSALYLAAFDQQKARLLETAHSQARMIEAIAQHEARYAHRIEEIDEHGDALSSTLGIIRESHDRFAGFGRTGEFTLAKREDDRIVFLLSHRHDDLDNPKPVPFSSEKAEPMRLALSGKPGTVVGLDYRGQRVLAAYEPVKVFDLGIVAKIDLVEVRAPFVRAGMFATGGAAGLILLGTVAFLRIGNPIVRQLEESERKYHSIVRTSMDGFCLLDLERNICEVNDAYCDLVGYDRDELLSMNVTDLEAVKTPEEIKAQSRKIEEAGYSRFETRHRCKDGSTVAVEVCINYLPLDGGRVFAFLRDITERRQAEKALRESEDRFRIALSSSSITVFTQNRDLRYTWVYNPHPSLSPETVVGKTDADLVPPGDATALTDINRRVLAEGVGVQSTIRFSAGGEPSFYDLAMEPLYDAAGNIVGLTGASADITERKQAEEALRESEERYRILAERNPHGIEVIDPTGVITYVNPAYQEMLGYTEEELLGKNTVDLLEPASRRPELREYLSLLVKERPEPTTYFQQNRRKDGKVIEQAVDWNYRLNAEGKIVGFISVITDITERKRVEADLKLQQHYLTRAQEIGNLGSWELDIKKNELIWTDENYRVFGVPLGTELKYETFLDCVHPDDRQYVDKKFKAALDHEPYDIEHRLLVDGKTKWVREKAELEFDEDGTCLRATGFTQDITKKKQVEEQLARAKEAAEAANLAKSQFLANMSHEIRTPMSAIVGYADLLLSRDWPNSQRREHLQTIHQSAKSLLTIINDVLDLSKIEAEKIEVEPTDCSLQNIVEEVWSLMQIRADEKQLHLAVVFDFPLPETIRSDPIRLRQVLVNLMGNAIKFTESGSVSVTVGYDCPENAPARIRFEVADTGIGMTEEEMGRLFQPFTQADMSHSRRFGGTGLGLSIARSLARLLGGDIQVQSQPGQGSTFTLTIDPGPLEDVSMLETLSTSSDDEEVPATAPWDRKLSGRVLLAEDDPIMRGLFGHFLQIGGLDVDSAEDGLIAHKKALASRDEGNPYDLILMDVQMPKMDGLEVTRRLRRHGWKGPIIVLTARAMAGDQQECLKAGCDDYVSKPCTPKDLMETISRHIGPAASEIPSDIPGFTPESSSLLTSIHFTDAQKSGYVKQFIDGLQERVDRLERALREEDASLVLKEVHALHGTAATMGFEHIAETALDIEEQAQSGVGLQTLRVPVSELIDQCKQVIHTPNR